MTPPTHIVLPESTKTFNCLIPDCGERFLNKSAYLKHMGRCARKHREDLQAISDQHKAEVEADPMQKVFDPEALEWVRKQIRDGRPGYGP